MSKALAELEEGIGVPLFVGGKRNLRPTLMCSRLAALAHKLQGDLQRAADELCAFCRGGSGKLLVGTTNAALQRVMPEVVVAVKAKFPNLTLSITASTAARLFDELRAGRLDIAIARVPLDDHPADLKSQPLGPMPDVLVLSRQHPSAARPDRIDWAGACESAWLWPVKGSRKREQQDRFWRQQGLPRPRSLVELSDAGLAIEMMQRQPLFAVLSLHAAEHAVRHGAAVIVPLAVDLRLGDLALWHLDEPQGPVVACLKDAASRAAASFVR